MAKENKQFKYSYKLDKKIKHVLKDKSPDPFIRSLYQHVEDILTGKCVPMKSKH